MVADEIPDLIRRCVAGRSSLPWRGRSTGVCRFRPMMGRASSSFRRCSRRSRIASTDEIRAEIETTLRRRGLSEEDIGVELGRIDHAPANTPVAIGGEFVIRKAVWSSSTCV